MGNIYGYVRVSSVEQNEGRQMLAMEKTLWGRLFPRAMRKIDMLAWIFDECREGQTPRSKIDTPSACYGVFDCRFGAADTVFCGGE